MATGHEQEAEKFSVPAMMGLFWCTSPTPENNGKIDYCHLWWKVNLFLMFYHCKLPTFGSPFKLLQSTQPRVHWIRSGVSFFRLGNLDFFENLATRSFIY